MQVYEVITAHELPTTFMREKRDEILLRADKDKLLYVIYPKRKIEIEGIEWKNGEVFIDNTEVPPFFLGKGVAGGILITDDIKKRIEKTGIKGAAFNRFIEMDIKRVQKKGWA